MGFLLRITIIVACVLLLAYVAYLVKRERLQLKYSLLWLAMAALLLIAAIFPAPVFALAGYLGFSEPSNFIFIAGSIFLLVDSLALTSIVSKQTVSIKNLTQRIAILENEMRNTDE